VQWCRVVCVDFLQKCTSSEPLISMWVDQESEKSMCNPSNLITADNRGMQVIIIYIFIIIIIVVVVVVVVIMWDFSL